MVSDNNKTSEESARFDYALWIPPLMLGLLLSAFLIYLLLPGTLLYPLKAIVQDDSITIDEMAKSQLETSLKSQIKELEDLKLRGVCTENGISIPGENLSLFPPKLNTLGAEDQSFSLLPPSSTLLDPSVPGEGIKSLSDLLNKSVVLVINDLPDGKGGSGSGFFISKDLIVTNQHVVVGAVNNVVTIARPNSREFFKAQIISQSDDFDVQNQDYAVLRANMESDAFLTFSSKLDNLSLTPVVSAGFPGDFIDSLEEFDAEGSGLSFDGLPLFQTNGVINAVQPYNSGGALIMHSAAISQGNSGGPLVNGCGAVVGINTFTYGQSDNSVRTLNIALRADGLMDFLKKSQLKGSTEATECSPRILPKKDGE
jgi:hypothetical protein